MKFKKLLAVILTVAMMVSLAACSSGTDATTAAATEAGGAGTEAATGGAASGETVSLVLWGAEEDQALLSELVEGFKAEYADAATFDISIGVESESTAKDTVLTDIEAAADVYAFADDQLNDLVNAGALAPINTYEEVLQNYAGKSIADIQAANVEASVDAATSGDSMYAFPMGAGNNYFLFYDSNVISAEQAASWDTLLDAAEAAGGKVGMTLASGWYNASFFLGAGFTANLEDDGATTYIDWNGTSPDGYTGVQVTQAMLNIASHPAFMAVADGSLNNTIASGELVAVIDGTWDADAAQTAWGDGYAATKLPTFTVGDAQVQQGCFSGFKLIGVNAYSENIGWAVLLAEYLTNEASQVARFEARQLSPTNINAGSDEAVTSNIAIAASNEQDAYGVIQRVGGNYWDPTASFGENIAQGSVSADDEAAIQELLDTLVEGVTAPVS